MAIQYLLVTFSEQRSVLADGVGVGFTNHIMMLPGDEYEITLGGDGYLPASKDIALAGTSIVKPLVIGFVPTTSATGAPRNVPSPAVADAKERPAALPKTLHPSTRAGANVRGKTGTKTSVENARAAAARPDAKSKKDA